MFRSIGMVIGACLATSLAAAQEYPRAKLLLEPQSLVKESEKYVVLDVRGAEAFEKGRIPGARNVDAAAWAKAFGDGADAAGWSQRIGAAGVASDSIVIVYDNGDWKDAARVWWILRYWGVEDARLLNGGYAAWQAAKLKSESGPRANADSVAQFEATPHAERLATKKSLLESLASKSVQIVDARSKDEHCGVNKLSNKRGGKIPGAKNLEWSDLIDSRSKRIKPAKDLSELFTAAGIDLLAPAATHCQSGGRSSVMAFGLELMGADHVQNYYASWGEWGNADDTPVELQDK